MNEIDSYDDNKPAEILRETSDCHVLYASFIMVVISFIMIICMIISIVLFDNRNENSNLTTSPTGWIAVSGAIIVFGSTGIPMKSPILREVKVDALVFSLYNSIGILLMTLPLILYLIITQNFVFQFWSILGSADIMIITYFAFHAIQRLGYAIAPAIWAGISMISAFLWGVLVFHESVANIAIASVALVLLILGVVLICLSKSIISTICTNWVTSNIHVRPPVFSTENTTAITTSLSPSTTTAKVNIIINGSNPLYINDIKQEDIISTRPSLPTKDIPLSMPCNECL